MKILLATDGSEFSNAAVAKCSKLVSNREDAIVKVICVVETITPAEPFGTTDDYYLIAQQAAREEAEKIVEDTQKKMLDQLGEKRATIEAEAITGETREAIVQEAENWGADLIIVGSHGRGFWGRMLIGSVSDAVVRHAPCSVLVVRKAESGD